MKDWDYVSKAWPMRSVFILSEFNDYGTWFVLGYWKADHESISRFLLALLLLKRSFQLDECELVSIDLEKGLVWPSISELHLMESLEWLECTLLELIACDVSWDSS